MENYDVIVCGGGTAGAIAGIAAARNGAKTLIVENEGFLGGTATYGIPFLGFFSGDGTQVVGGTGQELVGKMKTAGGSPGHMRGGIWNEKTAGGRYEFSLTPFDPEFYKYVIQEMALEAGAELALQTTLTGVKEKDGSITSIQCRTVEGMKDFAAKTYIDATGDAHLCFSAGYPLEMRGRGNMQNVSNILRIGNVDTEQLLENLESGWGVKGLEDWHIRIVRGDLVNRKNGIIHIAGHMIVNDEKGSYTFTGVSWRKEETSFNITRTINIDPTSARDITQAEINERRNINKLIQALRRDVRGFEDSYIVSSSTKVGIREGRRIKGEFTLTEQDVEDGKSFPDGVARGAYPIDIHDPKGGKTQFTFIKKGGSYSIPYPCLIPRGSKNVLTAGRCVSTTGQALGSVRLMACCMALGQAAGTAGALCAGKGLSPAALDTGLLRRTLTDQDAILEV